LHARVCEIVAALTGASAVRMLVWDADQKQWFLYGETGDATRRMGLDEASSRGLLSLTALRQVEQTGQALVLANCAEDSRFAQDTAFAGVPVCSFLALPIVHQGKSCAVLLLENRHRPGAFDEVGIGAVQAIAGPLAVSLENVLLYERLEQRVQE